MNGDLTHGPVMKTMLTFAVPMILGNLLQQCYNVADTLIVGRFLGPDALAAVGSSFTSVSYTHLLLQNSIDACHEKQALCRPKGESYHSRVVVEFISRPDGHATIRVSDNGIGMTGDVIKNYYMVAGSSYRYDPAWKKDYLDPDTLVPKVVRSGRFGIGVLSTFLLGDNIHVETVSYLEPVSYTHLDVYKRQ